MFRFQRRELRDLVNLPHPQPMTRASHLTSRLIFRWGKQLEENMKTICIQSGQVCTEAEGAGGKGYGGEEEEVQC